MSAHGISITVSHAHLLSNGLTSMSTRGHLRRYGCHVGNCHYEPATIVSTKIKAYQSNGYVLYFDTLAHVLNFARRQSMPVWVNFGGARQKKRQLA